MVKIAKQEVVPAHAHLHPGRPPSPSPSTATLRWRRWRPGPRTRAGCSGWGWAWPPASAALCSCPSGCSGWCSSHSRSSGRGWIRSVSDDPKTPSTRQGWDWGYVGEQWRRMQTHIVKGSTQNHFQWLHRVERAKLKKYVRQEWFSEPNVHQVLSSIEVWHQIHIILWLHHFSCQSVHHSFRINLKQLMDRSCVILAYAVLSLHGVWAFNSVLLDWNHTSQGDFRLKSHFPFCFQAEISGLLVIFDWNHISAACWTLSIDCW